MPVEPAHAVKVSRYERKDAWDTQRRKGHTNQGRFIFRDSSVMVSRNFDKLF